MNENVEFKEIMDMLDVDEMAKKFGIPHYTIRESYTPKKMIVKDYNEFMEIVGDYYRIHYLKRANTDEKTVLPEHYLYGLVRTLLDHLFGNDGGIEYAYSICVRGIDGGIKMVLDRIYQYFLNEDEDMYATLIIDKAVKLDWDNKIELVKQYQQKFKGEIGNIKMKDPNRLAGDLKTLIMNHVKAIAKYKVMMGDY